MDQDNNEQQNQFTGNDTEPTPEPSALTPETDFSPNTEPARPSDTLSSTGASNSFGSVSDEDAQEPPQTSFVDTIKKKYLSLPAKQKRGVGIAAIVVVLLLIVGLLFS